MNDECKVFTVESQTHSRGCLCCSASETFAAPAKENLMNGQRLYLWSCNVLRELPLLSLITLAVAPFCKHEDHQHVDAQSVTAETSNAAMMLRLRSWTCECASSAL